LGEIVSVAILLILVLFLLGRSTVRHTRKAKEKKEKRYMERAELITINQVIIESSDHISEVVKRVNKLFTNVVKDLSSHDLNKLSKTEKHVRKLNKEVNELREDVFYFIKSLDDTSVKASRFYILILGYLQDITQSIEYISTTSYKHVNNNHKQLKPSSVTDLNTINDKLNILFNRIETDFIKKDFDDLSNILDAKQEIFDYVSESLDKQISRIRTEESSPKNSSLYFGILLETKDLISALMSLLQLFHDFHIQERANNS
jgi:Na+/phosphate symporter